MARMELQLGKADATLDQLDRALAAGKRILGELVEDAPTLRRSEA